MLPFSEVEELGWFVNSLRSEGAASDGFSGVGEDASCLPWRSKIMSRVLSDCASVVGLVRFGGSGSVLGGA